mgnify:CR=1 FL=1
MEKEKGQDKKEKEKAVIRRQAKAISTSNWLHDVEKYVVHVDVYLSGSSRYTFHQINILEIISLSLSLYIYIYICI